MMTSDSPIVEEVRRRRAEISTQFGDDLDRFGEHLRELQEQYRDRLVSQVTVVRAQPRHSAPGDLPHSTDCR
jgi:hypothetical protein